MCRMCSSTSRTVDRACVLRLRIGRSMLFTLPLVGWVIRSILETDHVLKYHKLFGQVQWLWVFKQVAKSLEGELKLARQMP